MRVCAEAGTGPVPVGRCVCLTAEEAGAGEAMPAVVPCTPAHYSFEGCELLWLVLEQEPTDFPCGCQVWCSPLHPPPR